ncbi:hypothetical protein [Arthrobacter sp. NPDC058192]|uniref:hypothetical protein n=1 Tax=Arthrobacter sp. NPDC058192 TaxID=3346372 RepID=UPI0036E98569
MDPFTDTSTLPLSIAQVEPDAVGAPDGTAGHDAAAGAGSSVLHEQLLVAVVTRAGEVEAAEWALDQAKTARDTQVKAALEAGIPADTVERAAAGHTGA